MVSRINKIKETKTGLQVRLGIGDLPVGIGDLPLGIGDLHLGKDLCQGEVTYAKAK